MCILQAKHEDAMHSDHPLFGTHSWTRMRKLRIAQLLRDPPVQPGDDAPLLEKEVYAAYVLGNFWVCDDIRTVPPYCQLWSELKKLLKEESMGDFQCHCERDSFTCW